MRALKLPSVRSDAAMALQSRCKTSLNSGESVRTLLNVKLRVLASRLEKLNALERG
jgi:hypothetical protein